jgi:glycyl-tRNA synthetase
VKKDGLPELAKKIMKDLSLDFNCYYEEKDSIGKRYRRQDAIGTPICITVDHDSLNDQTVTIRYRDTMDQKRISLEELHTIIEKEVSMKALLSGLV